MAALLYGADLRLMACVRLRVKAIDFGQKQLVVRFGKGNKDRITVFPIPLITKLQQQLDPVRNLNVRNLADGFGVVYLPRALGRKFPKASRELAWQYHFLARKRSIDLRTGRCLGHHLLESDLKRPLSGRLVKQVFLNRSTVTRLGTVWLPPCRRRERIFESDRN